MAQAEAPHSKGLLESPLGTFIAIALLIISVYFRFIRKAPTAVMAEPEPEPEVESIEVGDITPFELEQYNGRDPTKPLLMAIKGVVYDVTKGRGFYGPPDGPYAAFSGRDASRALAKMSLKAEDISPSLEGLSAAEMDVLNDWEAKFDFKYRKVGKVVASALAKN